MGLRCLIGHDFGEVLTDRDREERGDEVVVTVREYRECDRCGEVRVVSENKEVRHRETEEPDEATAEAAPESDVGGAASGFEDVDGDDGIILEDEPEEPEERQRGAWPEADEPEEAAEAESNPAPWPEVEGEDEGFAAESADDRPLEGVEFKAGLTPEAAPSDPSQAQLDEEVLESSGGDGFRRASPAPASTGRQRSEAAETEFFCPECQFTTPTKDSSLRPGDICPSCRLGYLTEREP